MRPIGFVLITVLSTLWLLSISMLLLAIPLSLSGITAPIKLLFCYAMFRLLYPARKWPRLYTLLSSLIHKYPYFRSQRLVFESNAAVPVKDSSVMLAVFPHGAICIGGTINLVLSQQIQQAEVELLGSSMLFILPILSDILKWCSVGKVSKSYMTTLMNRGQNVALLPGGFEEAAMYQRFHHDVFLRERKGFVKYALRYGYKISLVYTFGEEGTYNALQPARNLRLKLARRKIPGILFWSKLGWLPDPNNHIVTVVGDPICLPRSPEPSDEEIEKYHALLMSSLSRLFDKYKVEFARDPTASLNIS